MAARKPFAGTFEADPRVNEQINTSRQNAITDAQIAEQRISFAFGNAPATLDGVTKESVRSSSGSVKLFRD